MNAETAQLLQQVSVLKTSLSDLARENAGLRVQRDVALAKMRSLLPQATPEQEAEMQQIMATGVRGGLSSLIGELEAAGR
jgi:regulator of replication initiation timing